MQKTKLLLSDYFSPTHIVKKSGEEVMFLKKISDTLSWYSSKDAEKSWNYDKKEYTPNEGKFAKRQNYIISNNNVEELRNKVTKPFYSELFKEWF